MRRVHQLLHASSRKLKRFVHPLVVLRKVNCELPFAGNFDYTKKKSFT